MLLLLYNTDTYCYLLLTENWVVNVAKKLWLSPTDNVILWHHLIGCKFGLNRRVPDGVVSTGLRSLHHRHPLVIITEEGEVEVRTAAVGLSADGQLTQQPTHRLGVPAIFGIHYGVFESEAQTDRYQRDNIKQQH